MSGISDIAKDCKLSNSDVKAVLAIIKQRLKAGEVISLQGFGNIRIDTRKATNARNPRTGERFDVPESLRVRFTASKTLKDEINGRDGSNKAKPSAPARKPKALPAASTVSVP